MKPLLPRRYLAENVENALLEAMREGRFGDFLPGERRLAEMLGVSRPTLRVALGVLTKQGHLRIEQGRRTRINNVGGDHLKPASTGRITLLSQNPLHELPPATLFAIDLLRKQLEEQGLHLEHRACHAFLHADPNRGLERLVVENPSDAWLLLQAPPRVQEWFHNRNLPAIIVGSPADGVELPGLDTDYRPAVRHAVAQLAKAGHAVESVALVIPDLDLPGHRAMLAGFHEGGGTDNNVLRHTADFAGIGEWIDRRFVSGARIPSAVIVAWPRMSVAILTRLGLGHGFKIPEKLSLISLSDDPAFDMILPPVTHYRRDTQRYVSLLIRLILRTTKLLSDSEESKNLMPEYVKGGTVLARVPRMAGE